MLDPSDIAGDVISGGSALAGLILVYLGSLSTGYSGFDATQQHAVRDFYKKRATFAFIGFVATIIAVIAALFGKWFDIDSMTGAAGFVLIASLAWTIITAYFTMKEIE